MCRLMVPQTKIANNKIPLGFRKITVSFWDFFHPGNVFEILHTRKLINAINITSGKDLA